MQKIILIGNYPSDKQESMLRFANMLSDGFRKAGFETEIWQPKSFFGWLSSSTNAGIGKWLGYIDKWLLFPWILRIRLMNKKMKTARFHICDHSNSPYLAGFPEERTSITCHDVLAIRGAFGHADAFCPPSKTGIFLQRWIFKNLKRSKTLSAVSQKTLDQLKELAGNDSTVNNWRVIYNSFNDDFGPLNKEEAEKFLKDSPLKPDISYLLHVGSDHPRKNRKLLIEMVAKLGNEWDGVICYAGDAIDDDLFAHAKKFGLTNRLVSIIKPNHKMLQALYCCCAAFIFPSFSEGFGWPTIEAQACGAPLIASNIDPMPEISGGAAFHADPSNAMAFANAFLALKDNGVRNKLIKDGFKNCERFENRKIIDDYLNLLGLQRLI